MIRLIIFYLIFLPAELMSFVSSAQRPPLTFAELKSNTLHLQWQKGKDGWRLYKLDVFNGRKWIKANGISGAYTFLYSKSRPDSLSPTFYTNNKTVFPDTPYKYIKKPWREATTPVALNTAGEEVHFFPGSLGTPVEGSLSFAQETEQAAVTSVWTTDPRYPSDIRVKMVIKARKPGYFSLASPSLLTAKPTDLSWGMIPGVFQGNSVEHDFVKAYAYGQGIPDRPVVVRERTTSTLCPLISLKNGITLSVIPDPGTARDPWENNRSTQGDWKLGLSLMNRKSQLTPTLYQPVLAQKGSFLNEGDSVVFSFRYSVNAGDWYPTYHHAVYDIYGLSQNLSLKQTKQSLTERLLAMKRYVANDSLSKWITVDYKGLTIGAQAYLGGVYNAQGDAMKNSDYGAMWMLAHTMDDSVLKHTRLPYARNFKKVQQQQEDGFFQGAAIGQYFLYKTKRFTEEWGDYVEPIALTYYIMMDIGNILLFDSSQGALKEELRKGADKLLSWMSAEGEWPVAFDRATEQPILTDLKDLRPTFYGLLIAYKLLGNKKYLEGACKGADWYIKNAVNKGNFLGVCGDTRFVPDFATGQSTQALLDLYDITGNLKYKDAAIKAGQLYTSSIYTHPVATGKMKNVNGRSYRDADISQVGLSFEHGGILGSANDAGPILLASHTGMFVRLFGITGDSIFIDMARGAALGRDAFVDPVTNVASYYWGAMNKGPGSFPHHAWWQIGWITDYLVSEMNLRSEGKISFTGGFITPKVGPHKTYGFASGKVYGHKADLLLREGMILCESPYVDYFCAVNTKMRKLYLIFLNNDDEEVEARIKVDYKKVFNDKIITPQKAGLLESNKRLADPSIFDVRMERFGISTVEVDY